MCQYNNAFFVVYLLFDYRRITNRLGNVNISNNIQTTYWKFEINLFFFLPFPSLSICLGSTTSVLTLYLARSSTSSTNATLFASHHSRLCLTISQSVFFFRSFFPHSLPPDSSYLSSYHVSDHLGLFILSTFGVAPMLSLIIAFLVLSSLIWPVPPFSVYRKYTFRHYVTYKITGINTYYEFIYLYARKRDTVEKFSQKSKWTLFETKFLRSFK